MNSMNSWEGPLVKVFAGRGVDVSAVDDGTIATRVAVQLITYKRNIRDESGGSPCSMMSSPVSMIRKDS